MESKPSVFKLELSPHILCNLGEETLPSVRLSFYAAQGAKQRYQLHKTAARETGASTGEFHCSTCCGSVETPRGIVNNIVHFHSCILYLRLFLRLLHRHHHLESGFCRPMARSRAPSRISCPNPTCTPRHCPAPTLPSSRVQTR